MSSLRIVAVCAVWVACSAAPVLRSRRVADVPMPQSIAVLPFTNLSDDPAAGRVVPSQILTHLVRHAGQRVFDLTANSPELQTDQTAAELGRAHQVEAVLVGTVVEYEYIPTSRGAGGGAPSILLHARLVAVADGAVLWRGTASVTSGTLWSRDRVSLEALAQEVAAAVVADLLAPAHLAAAAHSGSAEP